MEKRCYQSLVNYIKEWTTTCYNNAAAENFYYYAWLMGVDLENFKNKRIQKLLAKSMKKQMYFLSYMATCKMMTDHTKANMKKVKKWLAQNKFYESYRDNKPLPEYIVFFYLADGYKMLAYCDSLKDIDFQDSYAATFFPKLTIYNKTWKYITQARLDKTLNRIDYDMTYDGLYHVEYYIDEASIPNRKNYLLHLSCDVEGMPDIGQYSNMMRTKEWFDFLIPRVFWPEEEYVDYE